MTNFKNSTALFTLSVMAAITIPALAQAQDNDEDIDTIYVTGSNIKGRSQENSPSPLNVVSSADLSAQGLNSLGDLARNMTFNAGSELNTDAFTQNFSTGTANVNLRNLGLGSTLVLLNGKRQTLSAAYADDGSTFVDTNSLVPLIAISRVETLKDGGSAIYGTDAVSGVVNYITRKNFTGLELQGGWQQTTADAQHDYDISGIWGAEVGDGGNFMVAASFTRRSALSASQRPELTAGTGISGSGQPGTLVFIDQIPTADPALDLNNNGFIDLLPIMDPYCGTADLSIPNPGADPIQTGAETFVTPGSCAFQFDGFYDLIPEDKRVQVFTTFESDIGDNVHFYIEAAYTNNTAKRNNAPAFPIASPVPVLVGGGDGTVLPNVPLEVQPLVQAYALDTILFVGRALGSNGQPFVSNHDNETFRVAATLDGRINDSWSWETSANFSRNNYGINANDIKRDAYIAALTTGAFNPFGTAFTTHPNSDAALDAITAKNTLDGSSKQFTFDAQVSGDLAEFNDGMIQMAFGVQYRKSELNYDWSADYNGPNGDGSNSGLLPAGLNGGNLMFLYGGPDYGGKRDVKSVFGELAIPLHQTLDIQLAARYEDYGNGLDSFDPKISALWRPNDFLSARASYSTAFRAPSIYNTVGVQTALNEITLGSRSTFLPVTSTGNPDLKPETAKVMNLGFTIRPNNDFRFNVDYWRYDFTNLITQENSQSVVNRALGGDLTAFSQLEFANIADPTTLFHIKTNIINAPTVVTDGFDISTKYDVDLKNGVLTFGVDATYVIKYDAVDQAGIAFDGAGSRNFNNFARSMPKWRANFNLGYNNERHSAIMFMRYINSYQDDQNDLAVPNYTTFDLQYNYIFGDLDDPMLRASIGAINVFDKDVPRLQTNGGFDSKVHDPRGRMVYMRLSKQF